METGLCVACGVAGAHSPTLSLGTRLLPVTAAQPPDVPQSCSSSKASSLPCFSRLFGGWISHDSSLPPLLLGSWERALRGHTWLLPAPAPPQVLPGQAKLQGSQVLLFCLHLSRGHLQTTPSMWSLLSGQAQLVFRAAQKCPWAHGGRSWWITAPASSPCTGATLWCAPAISEPKC